MFEPGQSVRLQDGSVGSVLAASEIGTVKVRVPDVTFPLLLLATAISPLEGGDHETGLTLNTPVGDAEPASPFVNRSGAGASIVETGDTEDQSAATEDGGDA